MRPLYPQEKAAVEIVQMAVCDPEPVWTGVEKIKSLTPPMLKPLTLRPIASRYTDWVVADPTP